MPSPDRIDENRIGTMEQVLNIDFLSKKYFNINKRINYMGISKMEKANIR